MTSIVSGITGEELTKPKRRDYRPAPGKVTVMRHEVERKIQSDVLDLEKDVATLELEERFNIHATVARVGEQLPNGIAPFFQQGDHVTIEPSLFREVALSPTLSVWCGPFAGVSGVFEEVA
jgi:hypothetical protein